MNSQDVTAAKARMNASELELLEQLSTGSTPIEAVRLLEFFHYFPGCRVEEPASVARDFDEDDLETKTRWEVWEIQDKGLGT